MSNEFAIYWIQSHDDPRWNKTGNCTGLFSLIAIDGIEKIDRWIEECKSKYGEIPSDITYNFFNNQ